MTESSRQYFIVIEEYKKLIKFYFEIKELIAAAEREDGEQRISISAIAELRSAFDHVMRAHNVEYMVIPNGEIKETTGLDDSVYCQKNYDKAWGHLYRAGYDAYDCIAIGLIDKIEKVSNSASHQALHAVIPDAASVVANPYKAAKQLFTSAKVQKDVESRDQEKKQFEIYEQATKQLYDIQTLLDNHEAQMIAFDNEAQGNIKKQRRFVIIVATISGVASLIIGYLIRKFIG